MWSYVEIDSMLTLKVSRIQISTQQVILPITYELIDWIQTFDNKNKNFGPELEACFVLKQTKKAKTARQWTKSMSVKYECKLFAKPIVVQM